jgi:hypothetical protein
MAMESAIGIGAGKPMLEQARHQGLVLRHGHHAVANISGKDPQLISQSPGTPTVVGDSYECGEIGRPFLETAEQGRQASPAT